MAIVDNFESLRQAQGTTGLKDTAGNLVPIGPGTGGDRVQDIVAVSAAVAAIAGVVKSLGSLFGIKGETKKLSGAEAEQQARNFAETMYARYTAAFTSAECVKIAVKAQEAFNTIVPGLWGWNAPGTVLAANYIRNTINVRYVGKSESLKEMLYAMMVYVLCNSDREAGADELQAHLVRVYGEMFTYSAASLGLDPTKVDKVAPVTVTPGAGGTATGTGTTLAGVNVLIALGLAGAVAYMAFKKN